MTVKELVDILKVLPDDIEVSTCTDGSSPYDDYWNIDKILQLRVLNEPKTDRVCIISK